MVLMEQMAMVVTVETAQLLSAIQHKEIKSEKFYKNCNFIFSV